MIIFEGYLNAENELEIKDFCNEMAFDTVGLFDSNHIFSVPNSVQVATTIVSTLFPAFFITS